MSEPPASARLTAQGSFIAQAADHSTATVNVYQHVRPQVVEAAVLDAAQQLLAALPLDNVPPPATLPAGSRVPYARNPLFVGREPDLRRLAGVLKGGGTAAIGQIAAATGLGGIGKTQLAAELAHRYGRYFAGGVFWVSCADPAVIPAEVAACGGAGALDLRPDFASLKQDDQVLLVAAAWQGPLPRLLIFDNCEDPELLARWRPPSGGARVLVTSRRAAWDPALGVAALPLDALPRPESVALLRRLRPDVSADDPDLDGIAAELGDLPLALHLAGSFLATYRFSEAGSPAALLAELRRPGLLDHSSLQGLGAGLSPTGHEQHVARTFTLSYRCLGDPRETLGIQALARAARFAPGEPIPRALLKKTFASSENTAADLAAERALQRLNDLGLLETDAAGALRLHRLLACFVDTLGADPDAADAVEEALFAEAARINREGFPAPLRPWFGHLRHVAAGAESRGGKGAGPLWNELGFHLGSAGDYIEARNAYEAALRIDEAGLGPDHPKVAIAVNNLGHALHVLGDFPGARAACERALRIDEAAYGPDNPHVAIRINNLGRILQDLGDFTGARAAYERTIRINEAVYGPDHPKVAIAVNNLGVVLQDLGDLPAARLALERALRSHEAAYGPDHPRVAVAVNNLGLVLHDLGDLAGASAAFVRALRINETAYGPDHPEVSTSVNNLGRALQVLGDLPGARAAFERALQIDETALGPDHPNVAIRVNNLGLILRELGNVPGARAAFERAARIFEAALGPDHPKTCLARKNLAALDRGA
ncbi:MAG TPA: tetratricopeptide repeat protein [Thermoanaerobaculia bacterium]|nr:tetratricopeptide repeat protein [Thermoanaerobaculia bacterium]